MRNDSTKHGNLKDGLNLPLEATIGFAITIAMMAALMLFAWRLHGRHALYA